MINCIYLTPNSSSQLVEKHLKLCSTKSETRQEWLLLIIIVESCTGDSSQRNWTRATNQRVRIGKEKAKLSLFADHMFTHLENSKESMEKSTSKISVERQNIKFTNMLMSQKNEQKRNYIKVAMWQQNTKHWGLN